MVIDSQQIESYVKQVEQYCREVLKIPIRLLRSKQHISDLLVSAPQVINIYDYTDSLIKTYQDKLSNASYDLLCLYIIGSALHNIRNKEFPNILNNKYYNSFYLPIILPIFVKYTTALRNLLNRLSIEVINELKEQYPFYVKAFCDQHGLDESVIQADLTLKCLSSSIFMCNPTEINNLSGFFATILRRLLFWYLKQPLSISTIDSSSNTTYFSNCGVDIHTCYARSGIYRAGILAYEEDTASLVSPVIAIVVHHYQLLRSLLLNNELQQIFLRSISPQLSYHTKSSILKAVALIFNNSSDNAIIKTIKTEFPDIYKLLRSMHIYNPHYSIKLEKRTIEIAIYTTLHKYLSELFNDKQYISTLCDKVAQNFTNHLISGQYIDMLTFKTVYITNYSFVNELKSFIDSILRMIFSTDDFNESYDKAVEYFTLNKTTLNTNVYALQ